MKIWKRIKCQWVYFRWEGRMPMLPVIFVPITQEVYEQTAKHRANWMSKKPTCICGAHK